MNEFFKLKLKDMTLTKAEVMPHLNHRLTFAETDESHFVLVLCVTCCLPGMVAGDKLNGMLLALITEPQAVEELKRHIAPAIINEAELIAEIAKLAAERN